MVPRVGNETLRPLGFGPCFGRKLQTKKLMMYSPGGPFIMVAPVVMSWAVAGQRMVFLHMYLQTRVTLKAFPVATPRGRSVSFPTQGTMVTYITWDVHCQESKRIQQFQILGAFPLQICAKLWRNVINVDKKIFRNYGVSINQCFASKS